MSEKFLPTTLEEIHARGWDSVDIILVTGDAYVDHPSFGVALIGRWLEFHGFRVAILAQPRHDGPKDFTRFGRPNLFFGISAGNLDSIVANYSGNSRVRDQDDFSPNGSPYFGHVAEKKSRRRPDRAVIRYAGLARQAFADTVVVLGGIEASLRRFVHFDYQQKSLRGSVLTDAKADILVYGMGERAVVDIARRISSGKELTGIPGTCLRLSDREMASCCGEQTFVTLSSWVEIKADPKKFLEAELTLDRHSRAADETPVRQFQQAAWVVQNPAHAPLSTDEMDLLYTLPFAYAPHPSSGDIPAYRMIRHSVTIVRGCYGNCSYCAITRHQGAVVTRRSSRSVLAEIEKISRLPDFTGTISDLGGPTANMFGTACSQTRKCTRRDCLFPKLCPSLKIDEDVFLHLLEQAEKSDRVKHLYISSGLRMEILLKTPRLLARILQRHTPGALKIAPEHTSESVLRLMHKHHPDLLERFLIQCREIGKELKIDIRFTPYFISAHPGCAVSDMEKAATEVRRLGLEIRKFQDFTPTPGTLSTAMYVSGCDRDTLKKIHVARNQGERAAQRLVFEKIIPDLKKKSGKTIVRNRKNLKKY